MMKITHEQFEAESISRITPSAIIQITAEHQQSICERHGDTDGVNRMRRAKGLSIGQPTILQVTEMRELFGDSPGRTKCEPAFAVLEKLAAARDAARTDQDERYRDGRRRGVDMICPLLGLPTGTPASDVQSVLEEQGLKELAARVERTPWPVLEQYRNVVEGARSVSRSFASVLGCDDDVAEIGAALAEHSERIAQETGTDLRANRRREGIAMLSSLFWGRLPWREDKFGHSIEYLADLADRREHATA